jgi:hypothetical protein
LKNDYDKDFQRAFRSVHITWRRADLQLSISTILRFQSALWASACNRLAPSLRDWCAKLQHHCVQSSQLRTILCTRASDVLRMRTWLQIVAFIKISVWIQSLFIFATYAQGTLYPSNKRSGGGMTNFELYRPSDRRVVGEVSANFWR